MKDSLSYPFLAPVQFLEPLCARLGLPLLPYHIHELIGSLLFCQTLYVHFGPRISLYLASRTYPTLTGRSKLDWDIHVVSMAFATSMSFLAQYVVLFDKERSQMTAHERAYGYTELSTMTLALANGYFVWHLVMMVYHIRAYGWPMVAHAFATNFLMMLGFRPAFLTYGVASYLYEWSNIPLNLHRWFGKLNMQESKIYVANGITLFVAFFLCRICWGTYLTYWFYKDIWYAYTNEPPVGTQKHPNWLLAGHATSATILQFLNFLWFFMIGRILFSRVWTKKEQKWTGIKDE